MQDFPSLPVVGIPACVREVGVHPFHAVGEKYINAVAHASHCVPLLIPAFGGGSDLEPLAALIGLDDLIDRLDGLFLTGSPSNVEPHHYGGPPSAPDTLHDPQRDVLTLPLIRAAVDAGLPLFAVCRGFQELNVALGGTLHQRVQEVPGMRDHRAPKSDSREVQYALAHTIRLAPGGLVARLAGAEEIEVNSLHAQGVDRLSDRLTAEAVAPDGLIEAATVKGGRGFALGVQWHPEWRVHDNAFSLALFRAFGDAVRARAASRSSQSRLHGRVA